MYPTHTQVRRLCLTGGRGIESVNRKFVFMQKEKYHTHLAVLYMDTVLQMLKKDGVKKEELDIAR